MTAPAYPQSQNGAGFIGPDGQPSQLAPASWVPQPGQPGMPQPGQNWQRPFSQQGQLPAPQPRMGQDGMMQMGQPPMPAAFGQQQQPGPAMPQPGMPPFVQQQAPTGFQFPPFYQPPGPTPQAQAPAHPAQITSAPQPGQYGYQAPQQPMTQQLPPGYQQPQMQPPQGFQQPVQPQVPGYQQPMQPQQQPAQLGVFPNHPSIPADLRGQPIEYGVQVYNRMRDVLLSQAAAQQSAPPRAGQPASVPPSAAASSTTQQLAGQPQQFDWRNPAQSLAPMIQQAVADIIDQRVTPMLAPITQQSNMAAITSARQMAAATIPGFAQLEPAIMQQLMTIDPRALTNPETWRYAAGRAMLDSMATGQFRGFQQSQQPAAGAYPPQAVAPGQNPLPNLSSFFSEQPGVGQQPTAPQGLTPQQDFVRQQMGMSVEQYSAWSGGVNRRAA